MGDGICQQECLTHNCKNDLNDCDDKIDDEYAFNNK
jgi:hypothetical protein